MTYRATSKCSPNDFRKGGGFFKETISEQNRWLNSLGDKLRMLASSANEFDKTAKMIEQLEKQYEMALQLLENARITPLCEDSERSSIALGGLLVSLQNNIGKVAGIVQQVQQQKRQHDQREPKSNRRKKRRGSARAHRLGEDRDCGVLDTVVDTIAPYFVKPYTPRCYLP